MLMVGWKAQLAGTPELDFRIVVKVRPIQALCICTFIITRGGGFPKRRREMRIKTHKNFWRMSKTRADPPLGHKMGQKAKTSGFSRRIHPPGPIARYGPRV